MKFLRFLISKQLWVNIGVMLVVSLILFFLFKFWLNVHTNHNQYITLDDLTMRPYEEVLELLDQRGLNYVIQDSVSTYTDTLPPLAVLTQNPLAFQKVKEGRTIYIELNARVPTEDVVPSLAGEVSLKIALSTIERSAFELGEIYMVPSADENAVLKIMVDSVEIENGSSHPIGTKIDLVVGAGKGNIKIQVPCLLGKTLTEARFEIEAYSLNVGFVDIDTFGLIDSSSVLVYQQLPDCNNGVIKHGESIDLFLSQSLPQDVEDRLNNMQNDTLLNIDNENIIDEQ